MTNHDDNDYLTVAGGIMRRWRTPGAHAAHTEGIRKGVTRGAAREARDVRESAAQQDRGRSAEDGA